MPSLRPRHPGSKEQDTTFLKVLAVVCVGGLVFYVTHLEKVPETGRYRFIAVTPRLEAELAKNEHDKILNQFRGRILPPSHPVSLQIRKVVSSILEANGLGKIKDDYGYYSNIEAANPADIFDPDVAAIELREPQPSGQAAKEWTLIVVNDSKIVNAMAGYGHIIVFTGILPIAHDDQGLAAVVSHEVAHVVARHASERLSSFLVLNALLALLSIAGLDPGLGELALQYLYTLPNSRKQELEADIIGLSLAARACYDPRAAPDMQRRLVEVEKRMGARRINVNFLYTHPTGESRIKKLNEHLPQAYAIRSASDACALVGSEIDAFQDAVASSREWQKKELQAVGDRS